MNSRNDEPAAAFGPKKGTVLLVSGDLEKAILAFEIAAGFQAMGMEMTLWFALNGTNCIRKPRSRFSWSKWFRPLGTGPGRVPETDVPAQRLLRGLLPEGADNIPLSQLNLGGLGPIVFRHILRKKKMILLPDLIQAAVEMGVTFKICQICVDAMAVSVPDDLVIDAQIQGVSSYFMDVSASAYNTTL